MELTEDEMKARTGHLGKGKRHGKPNAAGTER